MVLGQISSTVETELKSNFSISARFARRSRSISATVELPHLIQIILGGAPRSIARLEKSLSNVTTMKPLVFARCQTA